nr:AraC family transcriptional regulator [Bacillus pumilus]
MNDIERAKRYIKTHFCEQITLEQTAAYVDLSPTYFTKRFKDETGLTFKEYVTTCLSWIKSKSFSKTARLV